MSHSQVSIRYGNRAEELRLPDFVEGEVEGWFRLEPRVSDASPKSFKGGDTLVVPEKVTGIYDIAWFDSKPDPSARPDYAGVFFWLGRKGDGCRHAMPNDEFSYCDGLHGFLRSEQGLALYDVVMQEREGLTVAEIGAYHGRSTCFLGHAVRRKNGRLYSIDTFQNDAMSEGARSTFEHFRKNIEPVSDVVTPVVGTSEEASKSVPGAIDVLFIDGDHSLKGCCEDLCYYFDKVADGGVIVFHDYVDRSARKRVRTVVDYFISKGMLEPVKVVLNMAITRKRPSAAILTSPKSKMGARTIGKFLGSDNLNVFTLSRDELDAGDEEAALANAALAAADGIVAHNTLKLDKRLRYKTVLYALQSIRNILDKTPQLIVDLQEVPFAGIYANSQTLARELTRRGLPAQAMYRPGDAIARKEYVPLCEERAILWYWKPDHPPMEPYKEVIRSVIESLDDVLIYTFPSAEPPLERENVIPLGRIDIAERCRSVRGLVRVSDPCDLGRSTFDVLACGRFVVTLGMEEEFAFSADNAEELQMLIRRALVEFGDAEGRELHEKSSRFGAFGLRREFGKLWETVREAKKSGVS